MWADVLRTKAGEHRCARCGELRHGSGFRFFRYGVGYCDACYPKPGPWLIGPGHYREPVSDTYARVR